MWQGEERQEKEREREEGRTRRVDIPESLIL